MISKRTILQAVFAALLLLPVLVAPAVSADGPADLTCLANVLCTAGDLSALQLRAVESAMAAYPAPRVTPLTIDERLLNSRRYQRVLSQVTIYDAPNGNPIGTLATGFNFFTTINRSGDWIEVNPGQWVQEEYLGGARISRFTGVLFDQPPLYPIAWFLLDTKPSKRPGAEPVPGTEYIPRYTLTNIYAVADVDGWRWYLVGPDQWVHETRMGQATLVSRPEGVEGRWIALDLYEQTLVAYEDDTPVFATLISSGLPQWPTQEGLFTIWDRYEATKMSGSEGAPDFYYLEEVPWVMFFDDDRGLHGTYWHDGFGYRHSHGCVNLSIIDAYWVYAWTADGYPDAAVYVYSSGAYRE